MLDPLTRDVSDTLFHGVLNDIYYWVDTLLCDGFQVRGRVIVTQTRFKAELVRPRNTSILSPQPSNCGPQPYAICYIRSSGYLRKLVAKRGPSHLTAGQARPV